MQKILPLAMLSLALLFADYSYSTGARHAPDPQSVPPSSVTITGNSVRQQNQNHRCGDAQKPRTGIPWGDVATWVLAVIGGVTACAVFAQVKEAANATKAMRDSIQLQEVAFSQWIEIGSWENGTRAGQPSEKRPVVRLTFKIGNATDFPFTLTRVTTSLQGKTEILSMEHIVPPKSTFLGYTEVSVSPAQLDLYRINALAITIPIEVEFRDILKRTVGPQRLLYVVQLGPGMCEANEQPQGWEPTPPRGE